MPNKYNAQPAIVDGIRFDSKREAKRWQELRLLERAGQIENLERQVKIELHGRDGPLLTRTGRKMKMTLDFSYVERRGPLAGMTIYEDAKGVPTRDYEVRKAVCQAQGVKVNEV